MAHQGPADEQTDVVAENLLHLRHALHRHAAAGGREDAREGAHRPPTPTQDPTALVHREPEPPAERREDGHVRARQPRQHAE